jgi:histone deacetylase 1/2
MSDPFGGSKRVVSYFYDDDIGNYQYNQGHPMKPFRVRMTDEMIKTYGMDKMMTRMYVEPEFIENVDFSVFHSDDYVDVLKNLTLENKDLYADQINRCKLSFLIHSFNS